MLQPYGRWLILGQLSCYLLKSAVHLHFKKNDYDYDLCNLMCKRRQVRSWGFWNSVKIKRQLKCPIQESKLIETLNRKPLSHTQKLNLHFTLINSWSSPAISRKTRFLSWTRFNFAIIWWKPSAHATAKTVANLGIWSDMSNGCWNPNWNGGNLRKQHEQLLLILDLDTKIRCPQLPRHCSCKNDLFLYCFISGHSCRRNTSAELHLGIRGPTWSNSLLLSRFRDIFGLVVDCSKPGCSFQPFFNFAKSLLSIITPRYFTMNFGPCRQPSGLWYSFVFAISKECFGVFLRQVQFAYLHLFCI